MSALLQVAAKALMSLLMSLATEAMFKEVMIMLAEMAAKSTKTEYDDRLVDKIKEVLEKEVK